MLVFFEVLKLPSFMGFQGRYCSSFYNLFKIIYTSGENVIYLGLLLCFLLTIFGGINLKVSD